MDDEERRVVRFIRFWIVAGILGVAMQTASILFGKG